MSNKSIDRYRKDEEYRKRSILAVRKKHVENSLYPEYVDLCRVRNDLYNCRESIEHHKLKIHMFKNRIDRLVIKKEKLEIIWGKIRGERKRREKNESIPST